MTQKSKAKYRDKIDFKIKTKNHVQPYYVATYKTIYSAYNLNKWHDILSKYVTKNTCA